MLKFINYKNPYHWLLLGVIACVVAFKWEALHLPFFWDEAWVYMPAIRTMAELGPSIMPASIDPDLYTGHPLLFYCLASSWIKFLGYSVFKAHLFPLLIAVTLLLSIYYVVFKWTANRYTSFLAVLLVAVQPIFLTQSTFLLIEVWLSLLFVWSYYFYFSRNWWGFSVVVVLALWSKESAFCLVPAFVTTAFLELLYKNISWKDFVKITLRMVVLFAIGFSFFIVQKIKLGWLFFPRHANWITMADFFDKMDASFLILFLSQGRNIVYLLTAIVSILSYGFLKNKLTKNHQLKLLSFLVIAIGFMLFASINFFSTRYLFAVIPLLLMGCALLISSIQKRHLPFFVIPVVAIMGLININISIENKTFADVELNYTRLLKAQVELCNYFESNPPEEKVYAPFLIYTNLTNPYSGFVKKGLNNFNAYLPDTSNVYFVSTQNESCKELDSLINNNHIHLVKTFENQQAKLALYKKQ